MRSPLLPVFISRLASGAAPLDLHTLLLILLFMHRPSGSTPVFHIVYRKVRSLTYHTAVGFKELFETVPCLAVGILIKEENSMHERQKTVVQLLAVFIGVLMLFLSSCGGGGGGGGGGLGDDDGGDTDPTPENGALRLQLKWETASAAAIDPAQTPGGDLCVDFEIDTIDAKVYDASGDESATANWRCSDVQGTPASVPSGSGLRVVVSAIASGAEQWRGESGDITLSAGEEESVDITMRYVGSDAASPGIGSTNLSEAAVDVPVDSVITATFTEKVVAASVDPSAFTLSSAEGPVTGTVTYDSDAMTATFTPDAPLFYNTSYTATITDSVMDLSGVSMENGYSWTFSTAKIVWLGIDQAIVKFSTAQKELAILETVNCQGISGETQFAVDPNDHSLWVSDTNNGRIMKVDDSGQVLFVVEQPFAAGSVVDPRDSTAWISVFKDSGGSRALVNRSALGFALRETADGLSFSIADNAMGWNASDQSIWYANDDTDVVKLETTGDLDGYNASGSSGANHTRTGGFDGPSSEVSIFSGSASLSCLYVAGGGRNVAQLDAGGSEQWRAHPAGIEQVLLVSADPADGSVWVGGRGDDWRVAKYAYDGTLLVQAVTVGQVMHTIEADPMDGGLWVGGDNGLIRLDANGHQLWRYGTQRVQSIAFSISPDRRNTIHVTAEGDDANGDGSTSTPFRTIGKALEEAGSGDSIAVAEGTYNENVKLKSNVTIVGSGSDTTIIMGLGTGHVVEGLEITNAAVSGVAITGAGDAASGVYLNGCRNVILRNNRMRDNGRSPTSHGIELQNASEALIEKNVVAGNFQSGIYLSGQSAAIVRNNIIAANGDSGIYRAYSDIGRGSYIINNVIDRNGTRNSGRSGIITGSGDIITNNIITNSGRAKDNPDQGYSVGIMAFGSSPPVLSYNNVWENYNGQYEGATAGEGAISQDPLFEDPGNGDYRLQTEGDSIINLGDSHLPNTGCNPSPFGDYLSDMGAYGGPFGDW
jgi:parallel beta-helix repeat protein